MQSKLLFLVGAAAAAEPICDGVRQMFNNQGCCGDNVGYVVRFSAHFAVVFRTSEGVREKDIRLIFLFLSSNIMFRCKLGEELEQGTFKKLADQVRMGEPALVRIDNITPTDSRAISTEMRTLARGEMDNRRSWKEWTREGATPPPSGHPQLTSVTIRDHATRSVWENVCKSLHGFGDNSTGITMVGNAVPVGSRPYGTKAHYHAPPVINLVLFGNCVKTYLFVRWEDATEEMKLSTNISEAQMLACTHTTAEIGMDPSLPNCVIFPAGCFHLIKTENRTSRPGLYLGFGTYFLLKDDAFIDDALLHLEYAMKYATWTMQLGTKEDAIAIAGHMATNWAQGKSSVTQSMSISGPGGRTKQTARISDRTFPVPDAKRMGETVASVAEKYYLSNMRRNATDSELDALVHEYFQKSGRKRTPSKADRRALREQLEASNTHLIILDADLERALQRSAGEGSSSSVAASPAQLLPAVQQPMTTPPSQVPAPPVCFNCYAPLGPSAFSVKCDDCDHHACRRCAGFTNEAHFNRYRRLPVKSWKCSTHGRLFHCCNPNCKDVLVSCEMSRKIDLVDSVGCDHELSPGTYCEHWVCKEKCAELEPDFSGNWYCDVHRPLHTKRRKKR